MAFQTRSGGNRFTGSAYEYLPEPELQHELRLQRDQPPGEERGQAEPVRRARRRPDRDPRACTTATTRRSSSSTTSRSASRTASRAPARSSTRRCYDGWFRYQFGNDVREVNLLQLAAANGQIATTDPTMMKLLGMIDAATKTTGTRAGAERSALRQLRLAEPVGAVRAPADGAARLQPQPTDHRLNGSFSTDHGQADARLPEQRRSAVSRARRTSATSSRSGRCCPLAMRSVIAPEHRQRAARRLDRLRQRLEFRLLLEHLVAQRSQHVRGLRRLRDHHAGQHDRLVHVERPELARRRRPTASKTR